MTTPVIIVALSGGKDSTSKPSDPVGQYWFDHSSCGSTSWIFSRLSPADRQEIQAICFQNANFDKFGELECLCVPSLPKGRCLKEYQCEEFAACLLMPREPFLAAVITLVEDDCDPEPLVQILAHLYAVEEWAVRYRIILLDGRKNGEPERLAELMGKRGPETL